MKKSISLILILALIILPICSGNSMSEFSDSMYEDEFSDIDGEYREEYSESMDNYDIDEYNNGA